jgi:hypothetical protein
VQSGKDSKLAAHIVRRLDLAAEGRAAKDQFFATELKQVGEVGMAAGKLLESKRPQFIWKMAAQKGFKFA